MVEPETQQHCHIQQAYHFLENLTIILPSSDRNLISDDSIQCFYTDGLTTKAVPGGRSHRRILLVTCSRKSMIIRKYNTDIDFHLIDFHQYDEVDMRASPKEVFQAFQGATLTVDKTCFLSNFYTLRTWESFAELIQWLTNTIWSIEPNLSWYRPLVEEFWEYAEAFH